MLRVLLFIARPRTIVLGRINNSMIYRSIDQYPDANNVPGVLILHIDSPIYFANANYLRERYITALLLFQELCYSVCMTRILMWVEIYSYFQDLEVDL